MNMTQPLSDADYLTTYGFARPVRKNISRTPEQIANRAACIAEVNERRAAQEAFKAGRPTAAQYIRAAR